jgi:hypothetical protein
LISPTPLAILCESHSARAPIAQLDRAIDYESIGREFESLWAHHKINNLGSFCRQWLFA